MNAYLGIILLVGVIVTRVSSTKEYNGTWQVSAFDYQWGNKARDDDQMTCARTGYTEGPWWVMDMYDNYTISGVTIIGDAYGQFEVRIGPERGFPPDENGFQSNQLCNYQKNMTKKVPQYVHCRQPRTGRYLSVMIDDPYQYLQLAICEIEYDVMY